MFRIPQLGLKKRLPKFHKINLIFFILFLLPIGGFFLTKELTNPAPAYKKANKESPFIYEAKNDIFTAQIGNKADNYPVVSVSLNDENTVEFKYVANNFTNKVTTNQARRNLTFYNVEDGMDIQYIPLRNGLKENIILNKEIKGKYYFLFETNLDKYDVRIKSKDKAQPAVYTKDGKYLFNTLDGYAVDANKNKTDDVTVDTVKKDGKVYLRVKVDQKWITDSRRKYPISIDPTIVHDTSSEFSTGQFNRAGDTGYNAPLTVASGGIITYNGGYTIHTFTGNGTFVPTVPLNVEMLIVGGGGGGGAYVGGGGGGGGFYEGTASVTATNYTITVGNGGLGGTSNGAATETNGGNSSIVGGSLNLIALGGGKGSRFADGSGTAGGSGGGAGGCSAGGGLGGAAQQPGSATGGYGYRGGNMVGNRPGTETDGRGGGGAGAAGGDTSCTEPGDGGNGRASSILGPSFYFAGGGGGGGFYAGDTGTTRAGNGGLGGGGGGGAFTTGTPGSGGGSAITSGETPTLNMGALGQGIGGAGGANTGGGGGGCGHNDKGGDGGSGIVVIRYLTTYADNTPAIETTYQELQTDQNTVALWHMNETSGSVIDASGKGNTGTPNSTTVTAGKFDKARYFNGTGAKVSFTNTTSLNPKDFTIEAWIKPESFPSNAQEIVALAQGSIQFRIEGTSQKLYAYTNSSGGWVAISSKSDIPKGEWTHVALAKEGSNGYMYINGKLDAYGNFPDYVTWSAGAVTMLGDHPATGHRFHGTIDEVRISNKARTADEIKLSASRRPYSLFTSSVLTLADNTMTWYPLTWTELGVKTGDGETVKNTNNLVAQWNFNETSGTTATNNAGSCGSSCDGSLSTSVLPAGGGVENTVNEYRVHTFTSNGGFTIPSGGPTTMDLLLVGGGGGGANTGSGGGAGGYLYNANYSMTAGAYSVTIGTGGPGAGASPGPGTKGGNTILTKSGFTLTAEGGGSGSSHGGSGGQINGGNGGSGGGGAITTSGGTPTGGTASQGYPGGAGFVQASWVGTSGGGGGAGGAGAAGCNTAGCGNGGVGVANSITGTSVYYAGGGGSGEVNGSVVGTGGNGGGGSGVIDAAGTNATANTGGGGGGGSFNGSYNAGGNGGSGIFVARYLYPTGFVNTSGQDVEENSGWTAKSKRWGTGALNFNGIKDYVTIPDNDSLSFTNGTSDLPFSVSAWIFPTQISTSGNRIIMKRDAGSKDEWQFLIRAQRLTANVFTNSTNYIGRTGTENIQPGKWYYVVMTYDGSKTSNGIKLYLNGKLHSSVDFNGGTYTGMHNDTQPVIIGYAPWTATNGFYGTIDSTAIYSRVLDEYEILSNYQAGNIELQTRVGSDTTPEDGGWEGWKPVTNESVINSLDSDANNWTVDPIAANPRSCKEILDNGQSTGSGVYTIYVLGDALSVYCDMTTDGGGWTLVLNNGSGALTPPKPTWTQAVNNNNVTGTFGTNLLNFDQFLGVKYWNALGNQMRLTQGTNPTTLAHKAMYRFLLAPANNYALTMSRGTVITNTVGTAVPGMYSYSAVNGFQLSTYDADHDTNAGNCSSSMGNTPWWYGSCWDGSFWGGGDSGTYQNAPFWAGSTTEYFGWGAIWIRQSGIPISKFNDINIKSEGSASLKLNLGSPQADSTTLALWHLDETGGTGAYLKDIAGLTSQQPFALGGTISYAGGYTIHTFTSTGTFTVFGSGSVDVMVVGGGGNGGLAYKGAITGGGGAGGGGVVRNTNVSVTSTSYTVTVGGAGAASSFNGVIGYGGANGGNADRYDSGDGIIDTPGNGGASGNGYAGSPHDPWFAGGGGGGAGAVGGPNSATGGAGSLQDITGSNVYYGGGGGGGTGYTPGTGGAGGGGNGSQTTGGNATYYGGGGGAAGGGGSQYPRGGYESWPGGAGYQGIVIIRYPSTQMGPIVDNDATPNGTTVVNGISSKGRKFDGIDDYIEVPDQTTLDLGSAYTIEFWVNPSVITGCGGVGAPTCMILNKENSYEFAINSSGTLEWAITPTWAWTNTGISIPTDKWTHIAIVYQGSAVSVYKNGSEAVNSQAKTGTPDNTVNALRFGARGAPGAASSFFNGSLDEIRITNFALSSEEIDESFRLGAGHTLNKTISTTNLSTKNSIPFYIAADRPGTYLATTAGESATANYAPDANTVGLWHFDEPTVLRDGSGRGVRGSATGTSYVQGYIGMARRFNGGTDAIDVGPSFASTLTNNFTISFWVNPSSTQVAYSNIFGNCMSGGGNNGLCIQQDNANTNKYYFRWGNGTSMPGWVGTNPFMQLTADQWQHIVITKSSTAGTNLYVNSVLVGTIADNTAVSPASTNFWIGQGFAGGSGRNFAGVIDEFRIDNVVRTADEVRQQYDYGLRTHNITIDFGAKLDSGNLITGSGDLGFTVDATYYGLSNKGSNLYTGEKIIVKENYDGLEYIAQGTVISVDVTTGAVTVNAWDSGSTFPTGGYSVNATVFKWQKEYWPVAEKVLDDQIDAVTNITLRITNGNEGRTIWLDDLKTTGDYLTNPVGSVISSSLGYKYMQYRIINTSTDIDVSPEVAQVGINYRINLPPDTPTLDEPSNNAISQPFRPVLKTTATDPDTDYLKYKIELCENAQMTMGCLTFDQTSNQTGWSNKDADGNTSYTSGRQAYYTLQQDLISGRTYFWRSYAKDYAGTNTWSSTQASPYSFTINGSPRANSLHEVQTFIARRESSHTSVTTGWSAIPGTAETGTTASANGWIAGSNFEVGKKYLILLWAEHNAGSATGLSGVRLKVGGSAVDASTTIEKPDQTASTYKTPYFWFDVWTATNSDLEVELYWNGVGSNAYAEDVTLVAIKADELIANGVLKYNIDTAGGSLSTTFADKASLTWTPTSATSRWWISGYSRADVNILDSTTYIAQLYLNGTGYTRQISTGQDVNETLLYGLGRGAILTNTSNFASIQISQSGSGGAYNWLSAGIFALNLEYFDSYFLESQVGRGAYLVTPGGWVNQIRGEVQMKFPGKFLTAGGSVVEDSEEKVLSRIQKDGVNITDDTGGWSKAIGDRTLLSLGDIAGTLSIGKKVYTLDAQPTVTGNGAAALNATWLVGFSLDKAGYGPTLDAPTNGATDQSLQPVFRMTAIDPDLNNLKYKIVLCEDDLMTLNCHTYDQTVTQNGWSGQDVISQTRYQSGTQAIYTLSYTVQTLEINKTYYWRAYAIDPDGTNAFSAPSETYSFTTTRSPNAPQSLHVDTLTNPTNVTSWLPTFSAIHSDPDGDSANQFQIQVNTKSDFTGVVKWESSKSIMSTVANNTRSSEIPYNGASLDYDNNTYYWRIRFWDTNEAVSPWSTGQFTTGSIKATGCHLVDNNSTDTSIKLKWYDKSSFEQGYKIQRKVNAGIFQDLITLSPDTTEYVDNTISRNNVYTYRVAGYFNLYTGPYCVTGQANTAGGNLMIDGIQIGGIKIY